MILLLDTSTLSLSSGALHIPVERDGLRVGELCFSPDDPAFLNRFYGLLSSLDARRKELAALSSGDDDLAESLTALERAYADTQNEIDIVFGEGTSRMCFGEGCSTALLEQFLDGVADVLRPSRSEKINQYLVQSEALS